MMLALPNDVSFGHDACLRTHKGKHCIIMSVANNIIDCLSNLHHFASGDTSLKTDIFECLHKSGIKTSLANDLDTLAKKEKNGDFERFIRCNI